MKANTQNTLLDLNNHLFEQLERLNDEELKGDKLTEEIERSKAIKNIALTIVSNANVMLQSQKLYAEYNGGKEVKKEDMPILLGNKNGKA